MWDTTLIAGLIFLIVELKFNNKEVDLWYLSEEYRSIIMGVGVKFWKNSCRLLA